MRASEGHQIPTSKPRLEALDSLRGISALMVVLYHSSFPNFVHDLPVVRNSYLFVDFFFVLSGFIMYYNYKNIDGIVEFRRFIGLRFFRLYPLHLATLLALLCWESLYTLAKLIYSQTSAAPSSNDAVALLLNLTLTNGIGIRPPSFNVPSWSISTEFWTYIIFGLIVTLSKRRLRIPVVYIFIFVSLASLVMLLRYVHPLNLGAMNFLLLPRCTFGFFLGATLCAVFPNTGRINQERRNAAFGDAIQLLLIVGAVLMISYGGKSAWDFSMPLIFAAIIASIVAWPRTRLTTIAESKIPMWLGRHSYSIYMVHWLAFIATSTFARTALHAQQTNAGFVMSSAIGFSFLAVTIALILAAASMTYRYIEEPGRQLGRRILSKSTH